MVLKFEIEINNIAFLAKNTEVSIIVNGVRNPSTGTTSTGWGITSLINTDLIDQSLNFASFDYLPPFSPSFIIFEGITPVPSNADVTA